MIFYYSNHKNKNKRKNAKKQVNIIPIKSGFIVMDANKKITH